VTLLQPTTGERLPIRTVASLTGVNPVTLRAWERRYGLLRPERTASGHRLYTHEHVALVRRVVALVDRGVPIGRAREALGPPAAVARAGGPWRSRVDRMSAAIARYDEQELDRIYEEALSVHPVEQVTERLLLPLLARLGERWDGLPGAIAEEHFVATYLRSKLGARLLHRARYADGPRLVTACAPGEHHEVGVLLFALEAQAAGLRTILLGADTPLEEVAVARRRAGGDGVVISSSIDPAPGMLDRALPRLVRDAGVPVFVGGATATRRRAAVTAAGAIALGSEIEAGVRLIMATLGKRSKAR
jgi:DNA-binding transcriptional MerR regulator